MNEKKTAPPGDLTLPSCEEVSFLWDAMSAAQDEAQSAAGRHKAALAEAGNLKRELRHLRKILDEKIQAERALRPNELHMRIERLGSQLETNQKILAEKERAVLKLKEEIKDLCSRLDEYRLKTSKLENEQTLNLFSLTKLENKISSLNQVIDQQTKQNTELSEKINAGQADQARLTKLAGELSCDFKNSQLLANAAMRKIDGIRAENDSLRRELSFYRQNVDSLEKKLGQKQADIISLTQEMEKNASFACADEEEAVSIPSVFIRHVRKPLETILAGLKNASVNAAPAAQRQTRAVLQKLSFILDSLKLWEEYADTSQYAAESCQLRNILDPLIETWKKPFSARKLTLIGRLAPNLPACHADPKKLKIAFYQIIRNAYEALPQGGILTVSSSADTGKNCVLARFADTGPGIPPKTAKDIYTPFACAKAGHPGLGIAAAKKIAEKSGGSFTISGQPKGGTLAEFSFPAITPEIPSMEDAEENRTKS